jgi:hypothetical protein
MKTFKEWLSPIKRGKKLQKKDIPHIEDHLYHSYIDKKVLDKIAFDNDAIYLRKTSKNIITSKDYLNKMTIDDVIQTLMKKVR